MHAGEQCSVYRETETKSLVKCILFLEHTSRFVSHFPRMSPAISSVCWIRRRKDTDDMYVSTSRRKGFRRDRFSLQCSLCPSPSPTHSLSLVHFPFCFLVLFSSASVYLFLSAGNGIATALPVVPKGIWNARDTTSLLQRRRVRCRGATDGDENKMKEGCKDRGAMQNTQKKKNARCRKEEREDCRGWV